MEGGARARGKLGERLSGEGSLECVTMQRKLMIRCVWEGTICMTGRRVWKCKFGMSRIRYEL